MIGVRNRERVKKGEKVVRVREKENEGKNEKIWRVVG